MESAVRQTINLNLLLRQAVVVSQTRSSLALARISANESLEKVWTLQAVLVRR